MLPQQGAVIVDSGTTTGRILELIPDDYELTIITNSVGHAIQLSARPNITTLLVGGRVRGPDRHQPGAHGGDGFAC